LIIAEIRRVCMYGHKEVLPSRNLPKEATGKQQLEVERGIKYKEEWKIVSSNGKAKIL